MRCTQVRDYLAAHKADLKQFWRRVRATKGKFWLLLVAGESECVPSDPTATSPVLVKALCDKDPFNQSLYVVRSMNQLTRAANSPLAGIIATLLRKNHSEGDDDEFFRIETSLDVCSMTGSFLRGDSALAAGRVADLYIIAAGDSGKPIFSQVFSCKRRGEHAVVETRPLETLFESAIDQSSSSIALELRRRVGELRGAELAVFESRLTEQDAFARETEDILEAARESGKETKIIVVAYQPRIHIGGGRGIEGDFVEKETERRSFSDFEGMSRRAAEEGLRVLDFRAASAWQTRVSTYGEGRGTITGGLADLVPAADRCLVDSTVVFMPDEYPFDETAGPGHGFPSEIGTLARRGRVLIASALDIMLAHPELLEDPLSAKLDCCRVWVPESEGSRETLRTLGGAALVVGPGKTVVFNTAVKEDGTPRFRTAAGVAAELAKERAKQKAEPAVALTGYERSTPSTKMEALDLEKMLVVDPEGEGLLNVEGAKSLLAKWTRQVKLYDDDNSYTVKWGGTRDTVPKDFKDIFHCEDGYGRDQDGKKFTKPKGALTMRYYITVLKDAIKDATGEDSD